MNGDVLGFSTSAAAGRLVASATVLFFGAFLVALGVIEYTRLAWLTQRKSALRRARARRRAGLRTPPPVVVLRLVWSADAGLDRRASTRARLGVDERPLEDTVVGSTIH